LISQNATVHTSSQVDPSAKIWDLAQVREGARIGSLAIIGRNVYIGIGVTVGSRTKIQNNSLIYEPADIGPGVFIGPGVILTNDKSPRAINPDGSQKGATDWSPVGVVISEGASIGAGSVCVAPLTIGAWSMIGAGSVVTKNVPNFALVVGNPARQIGWVGRYGTRLSPVDGDPASFCCESGEVYRLDHLGQLHQV
jgi:acetyltransferase-like isoleucine patch superfamily enzyme